MAISTNSLHKLRHISVQLLVLALICVPLTAEASLMLPPWIGDALMRPWTLLSYAIVHADWSHLLVNMFFAAIFAGFVAVNDSVAKVWIPFCGGILSGAIMFLLYNLMLRHLAPMSMLAGCSAGVFALMGYAFVRALLRRWASVRMRMAVIVLTVVTILLSLSSEGSSFVAHFGGMLFGVVYGMIASRRPAAEPAEPTRPADDAPVELLTKLRTSGYASLTPAERQRLYEISTK